MVHSLSPRKDKPFLRLNCAALTETLLESELFGHERGAFTGAVATKLGLLETADGGTVFLDEVGELPLATQVKLLRVIEDRQVMHVGGLKPRGIDVRFVSATNRDLELEIRRGAFREDLCFRVAGVTLLLPPLRERQQEIKGLAFSFIELACKQDKRPVPTLSSAALELLRRYHWPGNVRELRNVIERAVLLSTDQVIELANLPVEKMSTTFVSREARPEPRQEKRLADSSSGRSRGSYDTVAIGRPEIAGPFAPPVAGAIAAGSVDDGPAERDHRPPRRRHQRIPGRSQTSPRTLTSGRNRSTRSRRGDFCWRSNGVPATRPPPRSNSG